LPIAGRYLRLGLTCLGPLRGTVNFLSKIYAAIKSSMRFAP